MLCPLLQERAGTCQLPDTLLKEACEGELGRATQPAQLLLSVLAAAVPANASSSAPASRPARAGRRSLCGRGRVGVWLAIASLEDRLVTFTAAKKSPRAGWEIAGRVSYLQDPIEAGARSEWAAASVQIT